MTSALPQAREEEHEKNGFQKWCKVPSSLALGPLTRNKRQPRHQRLNELLPSPLLTHANQMQAWPGGEAQPWLPHFLYTGEPVGTLPTPAKLVWAPRSASWAEQRLLWVGPQHQRPLMGVRTTAFKLFYSERGTSADSSENVDLLYIWGWGPFNIFWDIVNINRLDLMLYFFFYSRCYKTS